MKILLQNTINGLLPLYGSDYDEKRKLKLGETYEAEIVRPRNVGFHRKFFALINLGWENTSMELPFEVYRKWVIMKAGYVQTYDTGKGILYEAESIAFGSMPEDRFEVLFGRCLDIIIKDIGATEEDIQNALVGFM